MPALTWDITVEQGSFEPSYIVITDPDTGDPVDLTTPGYTVVGSVATRPDGSGTELLDLPDASVWRRTNTGRIYFEPSSATSAAWGFRAGFLQVELTHPSGETVRVATGRFHVSPELNP